MNGTTLILASTSPRRHALLAEAGIDHRVIDPGIDDGQLVAGDVPPLHWVAALAYLKAAAGARAGESTSRLHPGAIVLGADTVVVKNGAIIGQPRSRDHAREILHSLRSGSHEVVTGVALLDPDSSDRLIFTDRALVRVGHLADDVIESYLDSNGWRAKAGAYNLSERLAAGWPIDYDGDPTTIMGLPMRALSERLRLFAARV